MTGQEAPKLSDAELYTDRLPRGRDCSEDAGFIITADTGDHDIYFYACAYVLRSEGSGIWVKRNGRINGTIFYAIPHTDRTKGLHDNPFARTGWHVNQYIEPEGHQIVHAPDAVEWRMGGRNYAWRKDAWTVTGSHGGVETELEFRAAGPVEWRWGPFEKIEQNDSAGYKVAALVNGTIRTEGKTFHLRDGYATCERAAVGQSRDIVGELVGGHEVYAFEIRGPQLDIQLHRHTGRKMELAQVRIGEQALGFGPQAPDSSVQITTLDQVHDPRSGLLVPSKWQIELASAAGSGSLTVTASGRSYFHYNTGGGVMLMMQMVGRANGTITRRDGKPVQVSDAMVGLRWGRGLLYANEHLSGSTV